MKFKHIILGFSATMLLTGCGCSPTNQHVELTAEQWNAAFEAVVNNFTYKVTIDNTVRGLVELNNTGLHAASYDSSGNVYQSKEEYIEWATNKNYIYSYDTDKKLWGKTEFTEDYGTKEYQISYYKIEITFINRFSDFSYDVSKGGYFASKTKTSEVTVDGEANGGFEVTNILVKFNKTEITEINFNYSQNTDGNVVANYSVTSIGSTKFTFPTIYQ